MTLVKLVPGNHPQQVKAGRGDPSKDERYTPMSLFLPLHDEFRFTVDVAGCAAAPVSQFLGRWYDKETNGLLQTWDGENPWGNVPFSDIRPWFVKMWRSKCRGSILIPANRTEQPCWQDLVEPYRDRLDGLMRTRFIRRRRDFGTPEHPTGVPRRKTGEPKPSGQADGGVPFGLVLVTWMSPRRPSWSPVS